MESSWDAIVVGAGPGGAAAAFHLARGGYRVALLERSRFPRDKSCGDGVTRSGVRLLREMGVLELLPAPCLIRGARVEMRGQGARELPFPLDRYPGTEALVVPRLLLDAAICRRAVEVGATLFERVEVREPILQDNVVAGVRVLHHDGRQQEFRGRLVIAADGANSRLARKVGLRGKAEADKLGSAIRGYYRGIRGLRDRYEFQFPLIDSTERVLLPSYGWVFPTGDGTANIGVGFFERTPGQNLRELMKQFVERLRREDARFADMLPSSEWLGAPLRFDFDPERCARPGLMLVGDAAGLVSPFTGEGISYAIESGRTAAQVAGRWFSFHRNDASAPPAEEYGLALAQRFSGYFETGRQAGARYRLIWQTLRSTFQSERPLHRLCRQLVLVPDGFGEPARGELLEDISPLLPRGGADLQRPMMRVADLLTQTVRQDWPFLARLSDGRFHPHSLPLRPSLLLLLAAQLGPQQREQLAEAGAAVELGYLAFLAHTGVDDRGTGRGNTFSVLVAEFLLAKAYALVGGIGAAVTRRLSEAVSAALQGQIRDRRLGTSRTLRDGWISLKATTGALGAFPCRLGAELVGASPAVQHAAAIYGERLAMAHALVDEANAYEGSADPLSEVVTNNVEDGVYGLGVLMTLETGSAGASRVSDVLARRPLDRPALALAMRGTTTASLLRHQAHELSLEALAAAANFPPGPARVAFERIARYAVERRLPERRSARELLSEMSP